MADQMPKPAKVPEPASDFGRVKKPAPDAFSNLKDEPGYANQFYDETFGDPNKMTPGMRVMFTLLMIGVAGFFIPRSAHSLSGTVLAQELDRRHGGQTNVFQHGKPGIGRRL